MLVQGTSSRSKHLLPSHDCPECKVQEQRPHSPGERGDPHGGPQLPSNHHCPRSPRLLHPRPGHTGAGREQREQPHSLIQTRLPLFPPSTTSPPLSSLPSSPSPPDLVPSHCQGITQAAAGTGAELSNPASIAIPWDQDSFFPLVLYGAEHSASTG